MIVPIVIVTLLSSAIAQDQASDKASDQAPKKSRHGFQPPLKAPLPFWTHGGGAQITDEYVRITPARQSRTGFIWNNAPSTMANWEATFEFKLTGQPEMGGDGFAFWYVTEPQRIGTVFGSQDFWDGIGIFFDTFNNNGWGDNPLITLVQNDKTQAYQAFNDAENQALASCTAPLRNRPKKNVDVAQMWSTVEPIWENAKWLTARISYNEKTLTLDISTTNDESNKPVFENCFTVKDLELGLDKYFGLTAHTGDVADNHDIRSFVTRDLSADAVDLSKVREDYKKNLATRQHQTGHFHEQVDDETFKSETYNLLQRVLDSNNVIEMTGVQISDYMHNKLENLEKDLMIKLRSIDTTVREYKEAVATGGAAVENNAKAALLSGITPDTGKAADLEPIMLASRQTVTQLNEVKAHLSEIQGKLSNKPQSNIIEDLTQTIISLEGRLSNQISQIMVQMQDLGQGDSTGSSGGSGWLTILVLVQIACTVIGTVILKKAVSDRYNKLL